MQLIIVESPSKAKTIEKYLGGKYKVDASGGHVRDLPEKRLGVNIAKNYEPNYVISADKKPVIKRLKEKVEKANSIYKTLKDTNPDDKEALDLLQRRASEELGICLINTDQLTELKETVNPKNFMNPYNAEKVALANDLYSILTREGLTYNELTEVQEKAKQL